MALKHLVSAPHRILFLAGATSLILASAWWLVHLVARYAGAPLLALDLAVAPVWAHSFLMLFTVLPAFVFGFLFTTFPRWMNGPAVPRGTYVATAALFVSGTGAWLVGVHAGVAVQLAAVALSLAAIASGIGALLRVLVHSERVVSHAVVASLALLLGAIALAGFGAGLYVASDLVLHFAVRSALWGFLFPVFFTVCHRMIPFFSQNVIQGYVAWRPRWMLVAVVALAWLRLLLGTLGALGWLPVADLALLLLTLTCVIRWSSFGARGTPLLWTLYVAVAWLPVAVALQTVRDAGFALTGEWLLGRAPVHALGIGFFGSMLVAMAARVTMGHSGRALVMSRTALACFLAVQLAAVMRVASELLAAPAPVRDLLLGSATLWFLALGTWSAVHGRIWLVPRVDGRPG
jgi:uncharacterized protein involved in response to NO